QDESELAYRRFWVSLLQWLLSGSQFLPGSDVALTSARRYYSSEQPMQFLISTRNLDRAIYQPRLVISGSVEKRELSADPDLMKKLASVSGGSVLAAEDVARMPEVVRRWEAAR